MRSLERVNIRTNIRTYVLTYVRTGQTLYPLHNFVVRGDKNACFVIEIIQESSNKYFYIKKKKQEKKIPINYSFQYKMCLLGYATSS